MHWSRPESIIAMAMLLGSILLVLKDTTCGGIIKFEMSAHDGLSMSSPTVGGILGIGCLTIVIASLYFRRVRIRQRSGVFGSSSLDIQVLDDDHHR
jgi:hypothetical protein